MAAAELVEAEMSAPLTKHQLSKLLGDGYVVESFTSRRLTQPGDNYGSNMQALEVRLVPHHSTLSLVAKLPPASAFLRERSNFGLTIRKEVAMYTEVSKVLRDIQMENRVPVMQVAEFLPRCYGAHVAQEGDKPIAEGSALLLENLGPLGYRCGDRLTGVDVAHAEMVVSRLARFHATAMAVKIKRPLVFRNVIMQACVTVMPERPPPGPGDVRMEDVAFQNLERIEECHEHIETLKRIFKARKIFSNEKAREPFACISHTDLWTNNIMFKYSWEHSDEPPSDVRFVDFQLCRYESVVRDLLFFLFTSTKLGVVTEHCDRLVKMYHDDFVDQLEKLGCDVEPFSFKKFQKEIEEEALKELMHIILMLNIIMRDKTEAPDIDEIKSDDDMAIMLRPCPSPDCDKRLIQVVKEYAKRGWLY